MPIIRGSGKTIALIAHNHMPTHRHFTVPIMLSFATRIGALCFALTAGQDGIAGDKLEVASEVCRSSLVEYPKLRERFLNAYPVGSIAHVLITQLRRTAEVVIDGELLVDPRAAAVSNTASEGIDWRSVKRDNKGYSFKVTCPATRNNARNWFVKLLSDRSGLLGARELRPSLDGEAKFAERGIPFSFDYFGSWDGVQRALRELIPIGTSRAEAIKNLNSIPDGYFGGFVEKERMLANGDVVYVYDANPRTDLKARLVVDSELGFVIKLRFDASQRLAELTVQ